MKEFERNEIFDKACLKWGFESQLVVACEELGELIVEVAKCFNGKRPDHGRMIDELADVRIMIEQIEYNYDLEDEVLERKNYKMERLNKLLSKEGSGHPVKG